MRAVAAAARKVRVIRFTPPNDHFTARPNRSVVVACVRSVRVRSSSPAVERWIVCASGIENVGPAVIEITTPNNHLATSPDRGVLSTRIRRVVCRDGRPCIVRGIVSSAGINVAVTIVATPNDHFTARPDRCVIRTHIRCVRCRDGMPSVARRVISSTCVKVGVDRANSAPHDHFVASPNAGVTLTSIWRVGSRRGTPTVRRWIISSTRVQPKRAVVVNETTPDYHFIARPHRGVVIPCSGGVGLSRRRPGVCSRIVSAACVSIPTGHSAPHNHLVPCPHGSMTVGGLRRVIGTGWSPHVGDRVIPLASVARIIAKAAPDDHLRPCPHRSMLRSLIGTNRARRHPTVSAWIVSAAVPEEAVTGATPYDHLCAGPDAVGLRRGSRP